MAGKIIIGADHGGFSLKEEIKQMLEREKYQVYDAGTTCDKICDYPGIGFNTALEVSRGRIPRGIVICKTGIGMAIITNKLPQVRAGVCNSVEDAVSARQHNDINVLVLAASKVNTQKAKEIVTVWLKTKALKGRYARRVKQIKELEKKRL